MTNDSKQRIKEYKKPGIKARIETPPESKYEKGIKQFLKENPVKLFISGHSHILKVIYDKEFDLLHINPGAAGMSGLHKVRTAIRFSIDKDKISNMEILELERYPRK